MSKNIKKANKVIVILTIVLLIIIAIAVGYKFLNYNNISLLDIKENFLHKFIK